MDEKYLKNNISIFKDKKIYKRFKFSESFGMKCERILFQDKSSYVIKYFLKKKYQFNPIVSEAKSLQYMYTKFDNLFPKLHFFNEQILVIDYIDNNGVKDQNFERNLALDISKIHKIKNKKFGFDFDTPIGGLKQPSDFSDNWVNFYKNNRLAMVFELINMENPMPKKINSEIEKIINNLENMIPNNPTPSLIHGDLWEGNILYNNGKLAGLIDPGINFAHNEMELAYLTWFKYVSYKFIDYYSDIIKVKSNYKEYEPIYQLYYCLLNVHLWSREYINHTMKLINKINKTKYYI